VSDLVVRPAAVGDRAFLAHALALAVDWRPGSPVRDAAALRREPQLWHYVAHWPRPGDFGFVAEVGRPVGAAWWRHFTSADPGYGYVDDETPEVAIGVDAEHRGRGVGTRLLACLVDEATRRALSSLSLSVEPDNPAVRLYERSGFEPIGTRGGSLTMVRRLAAGS